MKKLSVLIACYLMSFCSIFAQNNYYSNTINESTFAGKGVKKYTVTQIINPESDSISNIVEKAVFNKMGDKVFYYTHIPNSVHPTDSVFYNYDESGNLVEIININSLSPESQSLSEEMELKDDELRYIQKTIFYYNDKNQLIKLEYYDKANTVTPVVETYEYNEDSLISKKEICYGSKLKLHDFNQHYIYNSQKQLILSKKVYTKYPEDTLISTYTYNTQNKILKKDVKDYADQLIYEYQYENDLLVTMICEQTSGDYTDKFSVNYLYNDKGEIIEIKETDQNDEIKRTISCKYNCDGLMVEMYMQSPRYNAYLLKIIDYKMFDK